MESGTSITEAAKRLDAAVAAFGLELALVENMAPTPELAFGHAPEAPGASPDELRTRFGELFELNRDLENLIATISHDLRSPLRTVVGTSQIIMEDYGPDLPEDARDLLKRQVEAGKRMSMLVDDLVEYTRLGQGQVERIEFDLTVMAQDVSYELSERSWPHGVKFQIAPGLRLNGYPTLVRTVLTELMENAVKFSTIKKEARVELGSLSGPRERIYFVRDDGPGFSQELAGQIFDPFFRLSEHGQPGNGMGLASARKAVLKHSGRVWAESSVGSGATIFFTLG